MPARIDLKSLGIRFVQYVKLYFLLVEAERAAKKWLDSLPK